MVSAQPKEIMQEVEKIRRRYAKQAEVQVAYVKKPETQKPKIVPVEQLRKEHLEMRIYDEKFNPVNLEKVAGVLFPPPSLKIMAQKGFFDPKYDYLAWGMAIEAGDRSISFESGLKELWRRKISKIKSNGNRNDLWLANAKAHEAAWKYKYGSADRLGFERYKETYFAKNLEKMLPEYLKKMPKNPGLSEFRKKMASLLDANVLLGYSVQELIPGQYNALARIFLYEKFLANAGTDYLKYFPALHDALFSYGQFQFTPVAIRDIRKEYAGERWAGIPANLSKRWSADDHSKAAIAYALLNIDRAGAELAKRGGLERINRMFEKHSQTREGRKKLGMFITGLIGTMHYKPAYAREALVEFAKKGDLDNPHASFVQFAERAGAKHNEPNLAVYYRKSAEVYGTLLEYGRLRKKYS